MFLFKFINLSKVKNFWLIVDIVNLDIHLTSHVYLFLDFNFQWCEIYYQILIFHKILEEGWKVKLISRLIVNKPKSHLKPKIVVSWVAQCF